MDENYENEKKKRGRYKAYVINPDIPVPNSTLRSQRRRSERDSKEDESEVRELNLSANY